MGDLLFEKVWFKLSDFDPAKGIQSNAVREVAAAFGENIERVHRMIGFIPRLVGIGMRHQLAATLAILEHAKHPILTDEDRANPTLMAAIEREQRDFVEREESKEINDREAVGRFSKRNGANMMKLIHRYGYQDSPELESILVYMLLSTWTAFEVLAEDLVLEAIKEHPQCFRFLTGKEKWGFRSRRRIRESYKIAFPTDDGDIVSAVNSDDMEALALLRNVLVHKRGRADKDFRDGVSDFMRERPASKLLSSFVTLQDNDAVIVTGETIRSIIPPMMKTGGELLVAVDRWILAH